MEKLKDIKINKELHRRLKIRATNKDSTITKEADIILEKALKEK